MRRCPSGTAGSAISLADSSECSTCTAGFYCDPANIGPEECPDGYYCPEGTQRANEFPCPAGYYGPNTAAVVGTAAKESA